MVIYERDDGSTLHLPSVLVAVSKHDGCVLLASRCTQEYLDSREGQEVIP